MKKVSAVVLLMLVVLAGIVTLQKSGASEKVIRIGAILPLSGEAASYGEAARKGMDLAVEQVNAAGGVGGSSIQVVYEDTQGDPKTGVAAFQKLVTVDKVPAVVGDLLSSVTLSVAPIANDRKVVLLSPSSSSPKITSAGDYVFRNCPSDIYEGTIMAKFAVEKRGFRDIAILRINNEYGLGIANVFKEVVTASGGTIAGEEVYDENSTDFRTQITKIAQTHPSAVYLLGYKQMGYVLRQSRELGLKTQFLSTVTFEDPEILKIAGAAAEGVIFSASTFDVTSANEAVHGFVAAFENRYKRAPDIFAGLSYDAVKILSLGLVAGGRSGEGIKNALYQVRAYAGVVGEVSMDANGDAILTPVIKTVLDGKFVFLK